MNRKLVITTIYGVYLKTSDDTWKMWNTFFNTESDARRFCTEEKLENYYIEPVNLCTYDF